MPMLDADQSILAIVDMQTKLQPAIPNGEGTIQAAQSLVRTAQTLDIPVMVTEQYPKGLGATVETLQPVLAEVTPLTKTTFSAAEMLLANRPSSNRTQWVVAGWETPICIGQTVLELLEAQQSVWVLVDAVASRKALDHDIALQRLANAGAQLTTTESVAYEWLKDAKHPSFKTVERLFSQVKPKP